MFGTRNLIVNKTFDFAVAIVLLCQELQSEKREFVLSKQLLRSGTSVGANVEEAVGGVSRPDFINKMQTAYKEARESRYWLRIMLATNYINQSRIILIHHAEELMKILTAILNTIKNNGRK